jgi:hypothetical protein
MSDPTTRGEPLEFRFSFARPELLAGRFFGVTPATARVIIDGDRFTARFGPWRVSTSLANIAGASITGPYAWPKIIGPAHLSLRDGGLTFATTDRQGVCVRFRQPVSGLDPLGVFQHRALTVTVDDPPALVQVLEEAAYLAEAASRRRPATASPDAGGSGAPTVDAVMGELADDLHGMTARELRERARDLGIAGAASMKKDQLVDVLSHRSGRAGGR